MVLTTSTQCLSLAGRRSFAMAKCLSQDRKLKENLSEKSSALGGLGIRSGKGRFSPDRLMVSFSLQSVDYLWLLVSEDLWKFIHAFCKNRHLFSLEFSRWKELWVLGWCSSSSSCFPECPKYKGMTAVESSFRQVMLAAVARFLTVTANIRAKRKHWT